MVFNLKGYEVVVTIVLIIFGEWCRRQLQKFWATNAQGCAEATQDAPKIIKNHVGSGAMGSASQDASTLAASAGQTPVCKIRSGNDIYKDEFGAHLGPLCTYCAGPSAKLCSKCKIEAYCSQDCQRKDWRVHKRICQNLKLQEDKYKGRCVVAQQDFKQGDVIFEEAPLCWSPHSAPPQRLCVGCLKPIFTPYGLSNETHGFTCSCGYRFCGSECLGRKDGLHDLECNVLNALKKKKTPSYQPHECIFRLRLLSTKFNHPQAWRKIMSYHASDQSHGKSLSGSFANELAPEVAKALSVPISEIDLSHAAQVQYGNAWDLAPTFPCDSAFLIPKWPLSYDVVLGKVMCLGDLTRLVEHSCTPNCNLSLFCSLSGPRLMCRAMRPIRKGEHLSFSYITQLDMPPSYARRQNKVSGGFVCHCDRCNDITDCGTFMGSTRCSQCTDFLLPPSIEASKDCQWICRGCGFKEDNVQFNSMLSQREEAIFSSASAASTLSERRSIISRLLAIKAANQVRLHSHHITVFRINHKIAQLLGLECKELLSSEDGDYLLQASLGILSTLDLLSSACSYNKGIFLFYAARGSVSRSFAKVKQQWQDHFEECSRLLKLAQSQFLTVLGASHDLVDVTQGFLNLSNELAMIGHPLTMRNVGNPTGDDRWRIFIGAELCSFFGC